MKRSGSKNTALSVAVALALALFSAWAGFHLQSRLQERTPDTAAPMTPAAIIGEPAPPFTLPDLQGAPRSLSEWRGQVVALNFWATWCPPCREEIPGFVALQRRHGDAGLQFVGIALQQPRERPEVRAFVAEHGMNYPVLVGEAAVLRLAARLGNETGGLPYTVLLDRQGRARFAHAGPLTEEQAGRLIAALL